MKTFNLTIVLIFFSILTLGAQEPTPATEAGEDFDLNAVMSVMENAEDLADLEKKINDSEYQINNLDLNKDDEIDIVKVVELDEKETRVLVLRAVIGENDYQDVATIEIEKHSDTEISLQVIGDPDLYGADYILEPAPEETSGGNHGGGDSYFDFIEIPEFSSAAVFVSVHRWRPIGPLFVVGRVAFVSAVSWGAVPVWFVIRRPIARSSWRGRSRRYSNNRYRSSKTRHSRNSSRMYSNNRKKSTTAKKNVGGKPAANNSPAKASTTQSKTTSSPADKHNTNKSKTTTGYSNQQKSNSTNNTKKTNTSSPKKTNSSNTKKATTGPGKKKH